MRLGLYNGVQYFKLKISLILSFYYCYPSGYRNLDHLWPCLFYLSSDVAMVGGNVSVYIALYVTIYFMLSCKKENILSFKQCPKVCNYMALFALICMLTFQKEFFLLLQTVPQSTSIFLGFLALCQCCNRFSTHSIISCCCCDIQTFLNYSPLCCLLLLYLEQNIDTS